MHSTGRHAITTGARRGRARLLAAGLSLAATAGLAFGGTAIGSAHEQHAWGDGGKNAVTVPVSFTVTLQNRSGLPCAEVPPASGTAVVRGHIVGPAYQVNGPLTQGTLYSHGDGYDENFWSYDKNQSYNYTADMARRDHVSVTIDRLGYGASDKPNGNSICLGTEADVLHQIIGQLRAGTYQGTQKPRFDRVGLVGHSASGFAIEQEAVAFSDIDALGVVSSGELSATPLVAQRAGEQQVRCVTSPDGYAGLEADAAQFRADHIVNTVPAIADDLTARRTQDACAGSRNTAQIVAGNPIRNNLIRVPVLSIAGTEDKFFPNNQLQAPTYSGSAKVTLKRIPNTGHAIAFGRTAPIFRNDMNDWLTANKL